MALFTDGSVSDLEDLIAQDSQLFDVATVEGIDVTRKMALAQDELGLQLVTMLGRLSFMDQPLWLAPQVSLSRVVITASLKLWHTYRTLEMVYSDAYNSQLNDRYGAKRDQFHQMAHWASDKLVEIGIGIVTKPVPQAATPQITAIPGSLPDGTYYITTAWVNDAGQEGASAVPAVATSAASALQVQPGEDPPQNAVAWNLYAGNAAETMVLQNSSPIATGQIWQQSAAFTPTGQKPGSGQQPTYLKPTPRVIQRG
jgi:hypothetical protein